MKQYKEMTVEELRKETKAAGLKMSVAGKKMKKSELIEQLEKFVAVQTPDEQRGVTEKVAETETEKSAEVEVKVEDKDFIRFAETLEEICKKYGGEKKQKVYDSINPGGFVVFVHCVEAKDGEIYKKLRTAKITAVNRNQRLVRVRTILGTELQMPYSELLYIKENRPECSYPADISNFLRKQRTKKGEKILHDKFEGTQPDQK